MTPLSDAALLGVALGFLPDVGPTVAVTVGFLLLAASLVTFKQRRRWRPTRFREFRTEHALLGPLVPSFMHEARIDLMAHLFGDLLAISPIDLAWIPAAARPFWPCW